MFIKRAVLPQLEKELSKLQVTLITGMRQVGKTTLLTHLFEAVDSSNKVLFDLEDPLKRKIFETESFDSIWYNLAQYGLKNKEKAYIFLDEVQNLPQVSRVIKYFYDHWQVKFVLTGSSSFYLRHLFPESLAGRKLIFELFPLTFAEFLWFKGQDKEFASDLVGQAACKNRVAYEKFIPLYREYLEYGGFPAVVLEEDLSRKKLLLQEIFTSYFEKDVKNLADFHELGKLRDLILLLVPRLGNKLDIQKLATELGISRETVYNHLEFLEQTYFIQLLPKFSKSIDRQAAGSKKLFFCDAGIAATLGKTMLGQLFEQGVFQTLRPQHELHYFSQGMGREVDLILDGKAALEVKITASRRDVANVRRRAKALALSTAYVVSLNHSQDANVVIATELK